MLCPIIQTTIKAKLQNAAWLLLFYKHCTKNVMLSIISCFQNFPQTKGQGNGTL